jgi:hypothetical protein
MLSRIFTGVSLLHQQPDKLHTSECSLLENKSYIGRACRRQSAYCVLGPVDAIDHAGGIEEGGHLVNELLDVE